MYPIPYKIIKKMVKTALEEDLGASGDITAALLPVRKTSKAQTRTREDAVICGKVWVEEVCQQVDKKITIKWYCNDGDFVPANTVLFTVKGASHSLLTVERTALNFLQLLSGTATTTRQYVQQLLGTGTKLLDTRKTVPGFRMAQKYAVRCGGGYNHRFGLYDAFLIKENHIKAYQSISKIIAKARKINPSKPIEIEVENLEQLQEAIDAKADIVMLDNFTLKEIAEAVKLNAKTIKLEVSGNVHIDNIRKLALTGVDFISVGAITKNIKVIDLSTRFI